ncbi:hypothetical protein DDZ16_19425 [Marinilabilia rubra]|uniref:Uncharacterized protein n=1 Tax=Marinilabilia rubra TaxID=2162893 RepID=A0A2U2B3T6_9BACT|nr:hypothetical protein DDZ16_19425 [Marinilabilia rubra]
MRKYKISIIILIVLLIISSFYTFTLLNALRNYVIINDNNEKKSIKYEVFYRNCLRARTINSNLNPNLLLFSENHEQFLNSISLRNVTFLFYNNKGCSPCFDREIKNIKKTFNDTSKVVILTCFKRRKDFISFKLNKKINYKLYNISFQISDNSFPHLFYFKLNDKLKMYDIFIPNEDKDLTKELLSTF